MNDFQLPQPTFNTAKYEIIRTESGEKKRSYLENPALLEDELSVESYEAGISQQYQAIENALQNISNLTEQKEKLEAFLVGDPDTVPEDSSNSENTDLVE